MREVFQISSLRIKTQQPQSRRMRAGVNIGQLLIGLSVLLFGMLFYYFSRSAEHTYFLKILSVNPQTHKFLSPVFVTLANSLPTFIHVFAFSLMMAAFVASQKGGYAIVCLAWFIIDVFFELGQGFGDIIIPIIPGWFSNYLFLENAGDYFLHGRFDYLDLLSIALGALSAYMLLIITTNYKKERAT
jgi:hypothetical protein